MTRRIALGIAALVVSVLCLWAAADIAKAQPVQHCHADPHDRTRTTVALDIRNTGDGTCRILTAHRCGRTIRVRRTIVIRGEHRLAATIDCGALRLRQLRIEIL